MEGNQRVERVNKMSAIRRAEKKYRLPDNILKRNWGIITIIAAFIILCLILVEAEGGQLIISDGAGYYSYLPAVFIDHDISMKTLFEETKNIAMDYLNRFTIDESVSLYPNSYTTGVAIMQVPFFLCAHLIAILTNMWPADGISWPYQVSVFIAQVFYACLGLAFTYKLLQKYYDKNIALFATTSIAFATGLIFYSAFGGSFSHAFSFSAIALFLYSSVYAHEQGKLVYHLLAGMLLGLVTCCRVINIVFVLFYVLYGVETWETVKKKVLDKKVYLQFFAGFLGFILVFSIQMAYWKYAYGGWLVNSYVGATFSWSKPHVLEVLISAGRGLFIWHPIFIIAAIGIPYVKEHMNTAKFGLYFSVLAYVYVTSAWDCWWYGYSFGQRTFTDSLSVAALLIAAASTHFLECSLKKRRLIRGITLSAAVIVLIVYNVGFAIANQEGVYQHEDINSYSYSEFYQVHDMWARNIGTITNRHLFSGRIGERRDVNLKYIPHFDSGIETEEGHLSRSAEFLCFGPYTWVDPGTYQISVYYSTDEVQAGLSSVGTVTVNAGNDTRTIEQISLPMNETLVEFEIQFDEKTDLTQIVIFAETAGVLLRGYSVTRIS